MQAFAEPAVDVPLGLSASALWSPFHPSASSESNVVSSQSLSIFASALSPLNDTTNTLSTAAGRYVPPTARKAAAVASSSQVSTPSGAPVLPIASTPSSDAGELVLNVHTIKASTTVSTGLSVYLADVVEHDDEGSSHGVLSTASGHMPENGHRGATDGAGSATDGWEATAREYAARFAEGDLALRPTQDGEGGTYLVVDANDATATPLAVFKPAQEEIGNDDNPHGHAGEDDVRPGFQRGQCYLREKLAYELDHEHFAGVPPTTIVRFEGHGEGSLQRFAPGMLQSWSCPPKPFDTRSIQRIAILDIRLLNGDRHGGNLLVPKADLAAPMVPIDHAYCLPEGWADPDFEWAMWPQSKEPFGPEELAYIERLDANHDAEIIRSVLSEDAADVVIATTALLQRVAPKGYAPRDIAAFCRRSHLTEPCGLETALASCRAPLEQGGALLLHELHNAFDAAFP